MRRNSERHPGAPTLPRIVWLVICINMWGFAILGTLFVALGIASYLVDVPGLWLGGEPVRTSSQRLAWIVNGAAFGALGIGFVFMQITGRLRGR